MGGARWRVGVPTASGGVYVSLEVTYYMRGARYRRWCGWRGRRERGGKI